jgi:GPH family glycoside/pentoside/hexuronide:cation symporter
MSQEAASVPAAKRLAYAAPAFALAVVGIPVYVYIPKLYTDVVRVEVALVGVILMAARLFDAVTDPAVGYVSDRTRTRWGRRRPYLLGASIPLALSLLWLFVPPEAGSPFGSIWLAAGIFSVFFFWTLVTVPYESLGPELSFQYDERTAILGLRDGMLLAGTLAAAAAPALLGAAVGDPGGEGRETFLWMAVVYGPLVVAACAWCTLAVRERVIRASVKSSFWVRLEGVRRNRPFLILLASYTISALGSNLPATLILYYVEYVLESDLASLFLVLYLATGIAMLPAWVALSRRIGKKPSWLWAMAINSGAFAGVFTLGPGDALAYGILVVLSGAGLGATLALPSSMQADVIDYDELLTGERREGQYVGLWSIARKLAAALGVGTALVVLGTAGYQPSVEQTPDVRLTLRVLYCLVPCACNAIAFAVALAYPIDQARHRAIRRGVEARQQGRPVADPLRPGVVLGADGA